jgi:CrcB protein
MNLLAVVAGGLLGTGLRLGVDALLPHGDTGFPWSTLLVNIAGSFALGLLVARVWPTAPAWLRFGLGTGVLGSFTTFSALVASVLTLAQDGQLILGTAYLLVTLGAGIGAAAAGLRIGRRPVPAIGPDE